MAPTSIPVWPSFADTAESFYSGPLARPRRLLDEFTATGRGSGRRAGPRGLLWQAVAVSAVAALEAGLEDLLLSAHAVRLGAEGQAVVAGTNAPEGRVRNWLVEVRLVGADPRKIERFVFSDFGLLLNTLPSDARFHPRRKLKAHAGSGKGQEVAGPSNWSQLKEYLSALAFLRNAAAHGDASKFGAPPPHLKAEGDLWLRKADGHWSMQQPHALTAIRTVLAVYNTVAVAVATHFGRPTPDLTLPDSVVFR